MKTIKVKVYQYNELDENAKKKARNWYSEGIDFVWYDFLEEDFHEFLKKIGFKNVDSHFSGFNSQGDGASFDFKGLDFSVFFDKSFHDTLEDNFKPYSTIFLNWKALNHLLLKKVFRFHENLIISSENVGVGRYCHDHTRRANVEGDFYKTMKRAEKYLRPLEDSLTDLMVSLSRAYYKSLEKEWDYMNSEESIKENIEANEYTFTKDGKRFG
jgi:hypothetical protein